VKLDFHKSQPASGRGKCYKKFGILGAAAAQAKSNKIKNIFFGPMPLFLFFQYTNKAY
jgi:hypothetical protein